MPTRFRDAGQSIYTFGDTFLVRCPRCDRRAEVAQLANAPAPKTQSAGLLAPRRCVCSHCGHIQEWRGKYISVGGPHDWYFCYPLWLQTPCCGQTLWAHNEPHLRFLEEFVSADLRERTPELRRFHNLTYASRLPRWAQLGGNRDEVMRALARMRELLEE